MRSLALLSFVPLLVAALPGAALAQAPAAAKKPAAAPAPITANFKESGSASAKVTLELYTDYECPACREFFLNTLPSVIKDYVIPGKVHLVHRDFPLPQHKYTRQATRYANAAGTLGKYDLVANQLFQTQPEWSQNGNLDVVLARVLSPGDLKAIRDVALSNNPALDATVNKDVEQGSNIDHLQQTPTIVIVANGKRDVIGGAIPYPILKSYLDQKLK